VACGVCAWSVGEWVAGCVWARATGRVNTWALGRRCGSGSGGGGRAACGAEEAKLLQRRRLCEVAHRVLCVGDVGGLVMMMWWVSGTRCCHHVATLRERKETRQTSASIHTYVTPPQDTEARG
jgi:hypothetical protein